MPVVVGMVQGPGFVQPRGGVPSFDRDHDQQRRLDICGRVLIPVRVAWTSEAVDPDGTSDRRSGAPGEWLEGPAPERGWINSPRSRLER